MHAMTILGVVCMAGAASAQIGDFSSGPGSQGDCTFVGQLFGDPFSEFDTWIGDDFVVEETSTAVSLATKGFCGNGCVDPFNAAFTVRIYDQLPNQDGAQVLYETSTFDFDGIAKWTGKFECACLEAGTYYYCFTSDNDFGNNGQMYFYAETPNDANGWQWNQGGGNGWPDDLQYMMCNEMAAAPSVEFIIEEGCSDCGCVADCDGNGELSILDFVCYQQAFNEGCN